MIKTRVIHISRNGETHGPYSETEAYQHLKSGALTADDFACVDGDNNWKPLLEVLFPQKKASPSATKPTKQSMSPRSRKRTLMAAGAGIVILGGAGIITSQPFRTYIQHIQQARTEKKERQEWRQKHAAEIATAKEAVKEFQKLSSVTEAGLNFSDFKERVLDAKVNTDPIIQKLPDGEIKQHLQNAMIAYIAARDFWEITIQREEYGMAQFTLKEVARFKEYGVLFTDDRYADKKFVPIIWRFASGEIANVNASIAIYDAGARQDADGGFH